MFNCVLRNIPHKLCVLNDDPHEMCMLYKLDNFFQKNDGLCAELIDYHKNNNKSNNNNDNKDSIKNNNKLKINENRNVKNDITVVNRDSRLQKNNNTNVNDKLHETGKIPLELSNKSIHNLNVINKINFGNPKVKIQYNKLNGRPSINFKINGKNVQCLLDTGAKVNVIKENLINDISGIKIEKTKRKIICANDSELKNYGLVKIEVVIENMKRLIEFYVVNDVNPEMIVGIDFLNEFGIRLVKLDTINITEDNNKNQICYIRENLTDDNRLQRLKEIFLKELDTQMLNLLVKYKSIFMADKWDIGRTSLTKHKIETQGDPVLVKPWRQPKHLETKLEEVLKNLEQNGIIERCKSPWNFPLVCVWKKEKREIRLCVDFRQLNKITLRPAFPMPNVDDMLNTLNGARFFSTVDLGNAYYQVELEADSKLKTAFSTKDGQFCFRRMPFGIAAAPATFQELMTKVLGDLNWKEAMVYLDDILIFSRTREEHLSRIAHVFDKIKESGLKINPEKCHFMTEKTKFLGYIISKDGIQTDESKIEAINNFQSPSCIKHLRSFLGLTNYYRKFIKNYAQYSKPLESICGKNNGKNLKWTDECEVAFRKLKEQMTKAPVLAYPDFEKQFILDTDASFDTIGAVLSQKDEYGSERVIAYGSHKLNKHELGYCITRKELLAIYYFAQHFKHFLYGKNFLLRTDHKAITFMMSTKNPITPQFQTWINFLSGLDMEMIYRKGSLHSNADALSRNSSELCNQCQTIHEDAKKGRIKTKILALSEEEEGCKWQVNNTEIMEIKNLIKSNKSEKWRLVNGIVISKDSKIWIPKERRDEFIAEIHKLLCHAGSKKVYNYIKNDFDMEDLRIITKEIVQSCVNCQKRKTQTTKTKEEIIKQISEEPFQKIYIDFCGPFKKNIHGKQYIFAIIDHFSRYICLTAVAHQDEQSTKKILLEKWIWKHGPPKEIHMDKGKTFDSKLIKSLANTFNIDLIYSSPYHHNTNGIIERQFRTIRDAISIRMEDGLHKDWVELLPEIEFMLNCTIQATNEVSPAEIIFGRKITHWWKDRKDEVKSKQQDIIEKIKGKEENMGKNMTVGTIRNFEIGEKVLIKKNNALKDEFRFIGPAIIIKKVHERSYELQLENGKTIIRNVEWLKPFKERGM